MADAIFNYRTEGILNAAERDLPEVFPIPSSFMVSNLPVADGPATSGPQNPIVMKTHAAKVPSGILASICLLAGIGLLNSCATKPIELAQGTHWRDAAKVAGQPTVSFSYQMNGRKYDRVTFTKVGNPVVLENGRIFSVTTCDTDTEWNRRFKACLDAGELPFEKGLGPLHSLVMEQGKQFQKEGWPRKPEQENLTGSQIAAMTLLAPAAALGVPIVATAALVTLPEYAATTNSRQRARDMNTALIESGASYATFLAKLGNPDTTTSKGSYSTKTYLTPNPWLVDADYSYQMGTKNGKVAWVAYQGIQIDVRINLYRRVHGMPTTRF